MHLLWKCGAYILARSFVFVQDFPSFFVIGYSFTFVLLRLRFVISCFFRLPRCHPPLFFISLPGALFAQHGPAERYPDSSTGYRRVVLHSAVSVSPRVPAYLSARRGVLHRSRSLLRLQVRNSRTLPASCPPGCSAGRWRVRERERVPFCGLVLFSAERNGVHSRLHFTIQFQTQIPKTF